MNILNEHVNYGEETIWQIWNMCKKYNDILKITWKNLQRGLDMDFFLDKNNIPNETEDDFTIYYDENIKEWKIYSYYLFIFQW